MNYRDYFKKEAISAQLKDAPKQNVNPSELEKGIKVEMEHTTDRSTAETIARHHLAEDPKYYSHMDAAGLKECGIDDNGGLPKLGGALAIPHVGQPIHMSKIIQVGPSLGGPATGELSGFTAVGADKKGVAADKGGVKVGQDGDKETITAGGQSIDPNVAVKSVGGPVTPNKGEKQGGPNTKGTYADTAKMDSGGSCPQTPKTDLNALGLNESHKKAIGKIVKEVLKEIRFNKETGKWERIDENRFASMNPDRDWGRFSGGLKDFIPPLKTFDSPPPKRGTSDPEKDPVDRKGDFGEEPGQSPIGEAKKEVDIAKRNFGASQGGVEPNVYQEELNMRMGKSYKGPAARQYRTSDDDQARQVQYEPEITERFDEEEFKKLNERYVSLITQQRLLTEKENVEIKKLREQITKLAEWGEDDDAAYEREFQRNIARTNKRDPKMYDCPDCGAKGALTAYEKQKGYHCRQCTANLEGPMGGEGYEECGMQDEASYKVAPDPTAQTPGTQDLPRIQATEPKVTEAGGAAVQHSSYRTANDAPQEPENRHRGDIDETQKKTSKWVVMLNSESGDHYGPFLFNRQPTEQDLIKLVQTETPEDLNIGGEGIGGSYVEADIQEPVNVGESTDAYDLRDPDRGGFVSAGLKKLFQSRKPVITTDDVDEVGMSYIKDPDVAGEYAMKLAWDMAEDYGYVYNDNQGTFTKQRGLVPTDPDYQRAAFNNPSTSLEEDKNSVLVRKASEIARISADELYTIWKNYIYPQHDWFDFCKMIVSGDIGGDDLEHFLQETEKKSQVARTIEKGAKEKKATPKQKLAHKAPKKTKSGVHKKIDEAFLDFLKKKPSQQTKDKLNCKICGKPIGPMSKDWIKKFGQTCSDCLDVAI